MSYIREKGYYIIPTKKDDIDGVEFVFGEKFISDNDLNVLLYAMSNRPNELESRIAKGKEILENYKEE